MKNEQTNAKRHSLLAIALAAVIGFSFAACGDSNSTTYTGYDGEGKEYKLVISKGANNSDRDSRLANAANDAWIDNYPEGERDGFIFQADGTCYVLTDYTDTTPGVFAVYGAAISWATSGNSRLILSFGEDSVTYSYTVTGTTLTVTIDGKTGTYTKAAVTVSGLSAAASAPQSEDKFILTIKNSDGATEGTSTGTVSNINGDTYTLDNGGKEFTARINDRVIEEISGPIPLDGDGTLPAPVSLTAAKPGGGSSSSGGSARGGPTAWTAVADSTFGTEAIDAIAYGDGKFVAVGDNKIAYSSDGASWTAVSNSTFRQWEFESIAYGDGKFVAGASTLGGGKIAYSADGVNWTVAADSGFGTSLSIRDIAYGGGRFVAVGNRRMANSTNGISWTSVTDTGISIGWEIYGVAYGGGRFVAGGNHGGMTYSADGTNWTAVAKSPIAPSDMMDIAYGGGRFVAGGGFGTMAYSTDGATWTVGADGIFGEMGLVDTIAFGNGRFVAAGTSTGGKIAYSTNGQSWTAVTNHPFGSSRIYDIAYGGGRFVSVGTGGKMAYADW